jgi:hypothetical protein
MKLGSSYSHRLWDILVMPKIKSSFVKGSREEELNDRENDSPRLAPDRFHEDERTRAVKDNLKITPAFSACQLPCFLIFGVSKSGIYLPIALGRVLSGSWLNRLLTAFTSIHRTLTHEPALHDL